jgi:CheY-like chemotaxis protein
VEITMNVVKPQRLLIADNDAIFRTTLARWLCSDGHDVITAETGTHAFLVLREFSLPIDWLYARAALPGLVDGWILADAYHDRHAERPVILAGPANGQRSRGDIVLDHPSPSAVFDVLRQELTFRNVAFATEPGDVRYAA